MYCTYLKTNGRNCKGILRAASNYSDSYIYSCSPKNVCKTLFLGTCGDEGPFNKGTHTFNNSAVHILA